MAVFENFKDSNGLWAKRSTINSERQFTKSGLVWRNMCNRCTYGGVHQAQFPTYIGCTMSENFKDFQFFVEWHQEQIGFNEKNYHLDKDILIPGNKLYSEETCVLVPAALNAFFITSKVNQGAFPQGVCWHEQSARYVAQINISSKLKNIGRFRTVVEAKNAYDSAKRAETQRWIARLESKEFLVDIRVICALKLLGAEC